MTNKGMVKLPFGCVETGNRVKLDVGLPISFKFSLWSQLPRFEKVGGQDQRHLFTCVDTEESAMERDFPTASPDY